MNFSTDRDLLVLEPGLFTDVPLAGQALVEVGDAVVDDVALSSAVADFAALGVTGGHVALIAGVPREVVERTGTNTLTVSRLRARLSDAPIPPGDGAALALVVRTFAPQAALVHDELLRRVGIGPAEEGGSLTQDAIVSLSVMAQLEALGALERLYAGAAAISGENEALWRKASEYHRRFTAACRRATVLIDLDGDGRGDMRRPLAVGWLVRG